jgi:hypothetical protein
MSRSDIEPFHTGSTQPAHRAPSWTSLDRRAIYLFTISNVNKRERITVPSDQLVLTKPELLRELMGRTPHGALSVRQLAKLTDISKSKIHNLRTRGPYRVTIEEAERVAAALGVYRDHLFR